jgi:hypothetical protein
MKRMFKIFAMAAVVFSVAATTGCDADLEFGDEKGRNVYSVDNIPVEPRDWEEVWDRDGFGNDILLYKYFDLPINELTWDVINGGHYTTYFYLDPDEHQPVTKPLPHSDYFMDGDGFQWEYTLDAEYSEGNLRIILKTSDFWDFTFDDTLYFRLAIIR